MYKETITEEMHLEKEWFEQARKVQTMEELSKFINHMLNDYRHDYGTVCHAISACSIAAASLGAHVEGITGFQAGFIMWDFIINWSRRNNKCGLKLIDYDDFLYPHYADKYDKTISKDIWKSIQKEAKKNLDEHGDACNSVTQHWKDIVDGKVPFGYRIKEGDDI